MSINEPTDHSLIIRTLETVASLNTKLDYMLDEIRTLRHQQREATDRHAETVRRVDRHESEIESLRDDVTVMQAEPEKARDRWHQYAVSSVCGLAAAVALALLKQAFGWP